MSQHRIGNRRPVAALLTLTLTSGTLAGLGILAAAPASATPGPVCNQPTQTYAAGASGTYTVPAGATTVDVVASGAAGGATGYNSFGGSGATVSTTLTVTPGELLDFAVGTSGTSTSGGLSGSSASGGTISPWGGNNYGGGGGGATFLNNSGSPLVAAGGGGGGGYYGGASYGNGGNAGPGSLTSTSGVFSGGNGGVYASTPATGGSSTVGGGAVGGGTYYTNEGGNGHDGSGQLGGNAGDGSGSGGGGGGYKGGGGGAFYRYPSAGAAGSSYAASPYTIVGNGGTGSLTISAPADPVFQSAASKLFIENQSSTFLVCAPGGPGTTVSSSGTLPTGVTFVDNRNGTATLAGTPTQTGDFPLTFTSISSIATETQNFTLTVHDITAKTLVVSTSPTTVTAGGLVTSTVTAYDAQGAVATTDQDAISISSTDPQVTVPGGQLVNGVATFTANPTTVGSQTFTVTDAGITGTSNAVTVTPAAATSYTVVLPATATAGDSVDAVITALDPYGNVDTNDSRDTSLTSTDIGATLSPTVTLNQGTVTVPVVFVGADNQTVTATDADDASITGVSNSVAVSAAATSQLAESTPNNVSAGSTNWIYVESRDTFGNQTASSDTIHFASSDPRAVLPADGTVNSMGAPVVEFKTAGTQTVTVTDVTDPSVTSSAVTVTVSAGPVQTVARQVGDQQSTPAGHDFGTPLSVLVTDANGNPVSGEQVVFNVPSAGVAAFGNSDSDFAVSDANGVATSDPLTASGTVGDFTVNATSASQLIPNDCTNDCTNQNTPVSYGSTTFTETVTASDAAAAATAKTSSGVGITAQSVHVTLTAGVTITLLDASGNPATTVYTPNGTYVLDPTTGVINFVAVAGFVGTATPVTFQLTDAYDFQATNTYTPTVTAPAPVAPPVNPVAPPAPVTPPVAPPVGHPLGVAHVRTAAQVVLTGSTVPASCTVTVAAIGTCQTALTAQVAGRQVVLGTSSKVKGRAGATTVKTVVHLNTLGRSLAAQVGGVKATAWASVKKADGRVLSAKASLTLVDKHVVVAAAVLFPTKQTTLTAVAHRQLKALKAHLGEVATVTCIGYADADGNSAANVALGKARAKAVCTALAGHGVKLAMVTRGDAHPVADNTTAAGRALNRRVEITLTY